MLRRARAPPPPTPRDTVAARGPARREFFSPHTIHPARCGKLFFVFFFFSLVGALGKFSGPLRRSVSRTKRAAQTPTATCARAVANFSRRPSRRAALPADTVALAGYRSVNDKTRLCPAVTTRVFRAGLHFRTSRVSRMSAWITGFSPFSPPGLAHSIGERISGANDLFGWRRSLLELFGRVASSPGFYVCPKKTETLRSPGRRRRRGSRRLSSRA